MTTSRLFTISIDVLVNTMCNYMIYIRITWHEGYLIAFHVASDGTHPGKAPRTMIYILPLLSDEMLEMLLIGHLKHAKNFT